MKHHYLQTIAMAGILFIASATYAQPYQSDYSNLIRKGNEAYEAGDYDVAKTAFNDALLLRPEGIEAQKNLALSLSKLEEEKAAEQEYSRLLTRELDAEKRAEGFYNLSRLHLQNAQIEIEKEEPDLKVVVEQARQAILNANDSLELDPDNVQTMNNKSQAQHILKQIALIQPPPPQPQSGSGDSEEGEEENEEQQDQDSENEENQDQGDQQQDSQSDQNQEQEDSEDQQNQDDESEEDQEQQQEDEQSEGEDSENESDPEESEQDEQPENSQSEGEQGDEQSEGASGQAGETDAEPMTREQAEALLEMLGETQRFVLSAPRYDSDLKQTKDW